jgi:hypothetical protein
MQDEIEKRIRKDTINKVIEIIRSIENPYPKDIFTSKKYEPWRRAFEIAREGIIRKIQSEFED